MAHPCHITSQNRPACQLPYFLHRQKTKRWPTHNKTSKTARTLQIFRLKYCNHISSPNAYYKSYHLNLSDLVTPITSKTRHHKSPFYCTHIYFHTPVTSSLSSGFLAQTVWPTRYLLCRWSSHKPRINAIPQRKQRKFLQRTFQFLQRTFQQIFAYICASRNKHYGVVTSLWTNRLWHTLSQGYNAPGTRFSIFPLTRYKKLYG